MDIFEMIENGKYNYPARPQKPKTNICQNGHFVSHNEEVNYCPICGIKVKDYFKELKEEYKKAINEYWKKCDEIEEQFKKDALSYVGIDVNHPKAEKLFQIAWNEKHSSGLRDVVLFMEELSDLID